MTANPEPKPPVESSAMERLRGFIERVERLEEEKSELGADIREVYSEAKALGFDPKIMRKVVAIRKKDPSKIDEEMAVLDTYCNALGMQLTLI